MRQSYKTLSGDHPRQDELIREAELAEHRKINILQSDLDSVTARYSSDV